MIPFEKIDPTKHKLGSWNRYQNPEVLPDEGPKLTLLGISSLRSETIMGRAHSIQMERGQDMAHSLPESMLHSNRLAEPQIEARAAKHVSMPRDDQSALEEDKNKSDEESEYSP